MSIVVAISQLFAHLPGLTELLAVTLLV